MKFLFTSIAIVTLLCARGTAPAETPVLSANSMIDALAAPGPAEALEGTNCPYDWLIGRWSVRVRDYRADGTVIEGEGEWHFAWVLEGRAIQDVWISPSRPNRAGALASMPNRYGTSLRAFDPARKQWRVTWINPVTGAHDVLWARLEGADVVQEGRDEQNRPMRWVFTDIRPNSARWYGERSDDDGKTWKLEAEFVLTRAIEVQ
jgi:hypothetical protein